MDQLSIHRRGRECASLMSACLAASFQKALALETKLPRFVLEMEGQSGLAFRILINNLLAAVPHPRYLGVGSWPGATACAALCGNAATVICIDDCSAPGQSTAALVTALERLKAPFNRYDVLSADFRTVDYDGIGRYNIYHFAGPHDYRAQSDGIDLPLACLDDDFVLVAGEWNDPVVRAATRDALRRAAVTCVYAIEIRTTQDDEPAAFRGRDSEWHNGYLIGAFQKDSA